MGYKAVDVAKYVVNYCDGTLNKPISNLQLQKLLYYIQRKYLVDFSGHECFDDEICAWKFGPVVPSVYKKYCSKGSFPISKIDSDCVVEHNDIDIINAVVNEKIKMSPWDMVADTHQKGKAWAITYNDGKGIYNIILKSLIRTNG